MRALHATPRNGKVHEVKRRVVAPVDEFESTVKSKAKVIVDGFATWCGPCKAIAPMMEKLSEEPQFKEQVHFVKFDVDELPQVTQLLGVRAMPTFVLFRDGVKEGELVGADPKALATAVAKLADG
ncbi:Thioredoxin [Ophiocordyceps sinensis CO18]|uniref:Thioredoxin n=1 Tax=Ophiocordyceps sinensis (strain Co18 / CGMCC 3.14243) TaxID=911162 RepID=T5AMR1_OPHSC|nr:Thioredoxin [Ophiocordyceps sinensis CO18]